MVDDKQKANIQRQQRNQYFDRISMDFSDFSFLQNEVATRLFERLEMMNVIPRRIVEVGCADGFLTRLLAKKFPKAKIVALDASSQMIKSAQQKQGFFSPIKFQQSDPEKLPMKNNSMDLVISNLAYDYCIEPKKMLLEFNRVLKPGGLLLLSALGPDSLLELRQSWLQLNPNASFQTFLDMHIIGDQIQAAQFENTLMDRDLIQLKYQTLKGLLSELKRAGGQNLHPSRGKGLWGKQIFKEYQKLVEKLRTDEGHLNVTCELVFGHGWKNQDVSSADYHTYKVKLDDN
ncbi:MAG: methyltransferase domain-containing protein [Enterobacterales bacterium]|nr:methyltransferase domain-containing protein [Enterobacterales bacterium]